MRRLILLAALGVLAAFSTLVFADEHAKPASGDAILNAGK